MNIQEIVQGGAVGLAALALWILYKVLTNHLPHLTEAINKLNISIERVIQILDDNLRR